MPFRDDRGYTGGFGIASLSETATPTHVRGARQANTDVPGRTSADRAVGSALREAPRVVGSAARDFVRKPVQAITHNNPSSQMRRAAEEQLMASRGGSRLSAEDRAEADRLIAAAAAETRRRRDAGEIPSRQPLHPQELPDEMRTGEEGNRARRVF